MELVICRKCGVKLWNLYSINLQCPSCRGGFGFNPDVDVDVDVDVDIDDNDVNVNVDDNDISCVDDICVGVSLEDVLALRDTEWCRNHYWV